MMGKTLECPACHQKFMLDAGADAEPMAQTRPFRPFAAQPAPEAQPHEVDPGGLGMPPRLRHYGRVGTCFYGLLLMGLFFVPLALDANDQPLFCWHYTDLGLPARTLTVAIVLLSLGALAVVSGIVLSGPALGVLALGAGVGGALTWYFVLKPPLGPMAGNVAAAHVCMLIGVPLALIGLRLRAIFERGVMGRLWLVPGLTLLVLGCLLPVAGRLPAIHSLKNIRVDVASGLYIGAGLAVVFGLVSLIPGAARVAIMGATAVILGVMSPFVRVVIEEVVARLERVQAANRALNAAGQGPDVTLGMNPLLNEVLLPLGIPMLRIVALLVLTVCGGVLLLGAVTWRPKAPPVPVVNTGS